MDGVDYANNLLTAGELLTAVDLGRSQARYQALEKLDAAQLRLDSVCLSDPAVWAVLPRRRLGWLGVKMAICKTVPVLF